MQVMFTYHTKVRLKDTDATGVLYFSEQFKMALEAFEEFLFCQGFSLRELLDTSYLMPIVHAEADFIAPLRVGDPLEITVQVGKIGTSSIALQYAFFDPNRSISVGRVEIVHVVIDREKGVSVPIPDFLIKLLTQRV